MRRRCPDTIFLSPPGQSLQSSPSQSSATDSTLLPTARRQTSRDWCHFSTEVCVKRNQILFYELRLWDRLVSSSSHFFILITLLSTSRHPHLNHDASHPPRRSCLPGRGAKTCQQVLHNILSCLSHPGDKKDTFRREDADHLRSKLRSVRLFSHPRSGIESHE